MNKNNQLVPSIALFAVILIGYLLMPLESDSLATIAATLVLIVTVLAVLATRLLRHLPVAIFVLLVLGLAAVGIFSNTEAGYNEQEIAFAMNISTEAFGTILLLLLFVRGRNLWTLTIAGAVAMAALYVIEINPGTLTSDFLLNLTTEIIGAFLLAMVLQRFEVAQEKTL